MITILISCPFCGSVTELNVPFEEYFAWNFEGVLVQDAFPELTATEREMLISGLCPDCQKNFFDEL